MTAGPNIGSGPPWPKPTLQVDSFRGGRPVLPMTYASTDASYGTQICFVMRAAMQVGAARLIGPAIVLLSILCVSAEVAQAAEIELHNDHPEGCSATLVGPIQPGDTRKVREVFPFDVDGFLGGGGATLCFHSAGGSFLEGLALAEYITEAGIQTHVGADRSCLSACALAFLGGRYAWFEERVQRVVGRTLHADATLGFHAPYLDIPDSQFDQAAVRQAYNTAVEGVAVVFSRLEELAISRDFALTFLSAIGEEFHYINTPLRVDQLDARVVGTVEMPSRVSDTKLASICELKVPPLRQFAPFEEPAAYRFPADGGGTLHVQAVPFFAEGSKYWHLCQVQVGDDARVFPFHDGELHVAGFEDSFYFPFQVPRDYIPTEREILEWIRSGPRTSWQALPPTLLAEGDPPLSNLSAGEARLPRPASYPSADRSCAPIASRYTVRNVKQYATLRAAASYDSEVVARVPLGQDLKPTSHAFSDVAFASERCRAVCDIEGRGRVSLDPNVNGFVEGPSSAISYCSRDHAIWWRMEGPDGRAGWMSRHYLTR